MCPLHIDSTSSYATLRDRPPDPRITELVAPRRSKESLVSLTLIPLDPPTPQSHTAVYSLAAEIATCNETICVLADPILGLIAWCHPLITLGIELNLDFNLELAAAPVFDTGG